MQLTGSPFRKRPWPLRVCFSYFAPSLTNFVCRAFIDHDDCARSSYLSLYSAVCTTHVDTLCVSWLSTTASSVKEETKWREFIDGLERSIGPMLWV